MREQEMRRRVFDFLRARMRNMIMPATVGLGLAVGGCDSSNPTDPQTLTDAAPDKDGPPAAPDAVPDSVRADLRPDAAPADVAAEADAADPDSAMGSDGSASTVDVVVDGGVVDAGQPFSDAASFDGSPPSADGRLDVTLTKYSAPLRDAGPDSPVVRYQASFQSDADMAVPLYIAPMKR